MTLLRNIFQTSGLRLRPMILLETASMISVNLLLLAVTGSYSQRISLSKKTWHVHIAQKLCDWTPVADEFPATYWLDVPEWFASVQPDNVLCANCTILKTQPIFVLVALTSLFEASPAAVR